MIEEKSSGLGGWWKGVWDKTSQMIDTKQADFVRGKIAGVQVTDAHGVVLVEAGQRINDEIITTAHHAGKIGDLVSSVIQGQGQDIKEQVQTQYGRTEKAQESLLLDSVEEYRDAHRYLGRTLTMDVTDIRGHILVPSGKVLDRDDIILAREAGQLAAFLAAAEQSLPPVSQNSSMLTSSIPSTPRTTRTLLAVPDEE